MPDEFKFCDSYELKQYSGELCAGDVVIIKHDLPIKFHDGSFGGKTIMKGTKHFVLPGQLSDPNDVRLGRFFYHRPERCVWPLDVFWQTFEKIEERHSYSHGYFSD